MLSKTLCLAVSVQLVMAFNHDRTLLKERTPQYSQDWDNTNVRYLGVLNRNRRQTPQIPDSIIDEVFGLPELKNKNPPPKRQTIMIPMPDLPPGVVNFYQNTYVPNGNQINYYLGQMTPLGWAQRVAGGIVHLPYFIPIFYCIFPPSPNSSVSIDNRFLFPDDPILNGLGGQGPTYQPDRPVFQPAPPPTYQTSRPVYQPTSTTTTPAPNVVPEEPDGYPEKVTDTPSGISLTPARPQRPQSIVPPPVKHEVSSSSNSGDSQPQAAYVPPPVRGGNTNRVYSSEVPQSIARPNARPRPSAAAAPSMTSSNNADCATAIRYCCSQYAPGNSREYCLTSRGCGGPLWADGDICDSVG